MKITQLQINKGQIEGLPANPRFIKDDKYKKLVKSIQENPEMLELRELLVYPYGGKYVIIGGNMRYRACKELGYTDIPVKIIPETATVEQLRAYTIKDNNGFGEWDFDMLSDEWDLSELENWGVDFPNMDLEREETEIVEDEATDTYEQKKKEFEERMASGELSDDDEEYQEFLAKFEAKKTTDDCYTPPIVYEAVADYVAEKYGIDKKNFVRPFVPKGDYQAETYKETDVVVDNPPFSIMAEILNYYNEHGVKFFLFAPHLTIFSSSSSCSCIICGVAITYENGANVSTSFVTNLEDCAFRSSPTLYEKIKTANDENLRKGRKELPKYSYPLSVITSNMLTNFSRYGIDFEVAKDECFFIRQLDSQKESKKVLFGSGYLISERKRAEREKAEREKAEREKADREKAEREKAEREKAEREKAEVWELSERELTIIHGLK